jgi:hypothetical protein
MSLDQLAEQLLGFGQCNAPLFSYFVHAPFLSSGTLVPIDQVTLGALYNHPGCDS